MKNKAISNVFLWLTPMIWGVAFVTQRVAGDYLGSLTYNAIRFSIGAVTLIPVFLIFERGDGIKDKMKTTIFAGILSGLCLFSASTLQQYAIVITQSAGKAGFLTGLYTVFVPVIGIFMHKKTTVFTWIGVAAAVGGMYLLSFEGDTPFGIGDVLLILCALLFAIQIIIIDRFGERIYPLRFSFIQTAVTALLSTAGALIFETCEWSDVQAASTAILYGGIMSVGVAYTFQILGQRGNDETYSAIVLSTESVFAAISGALILHEAMNTKSYIGCALIFAGIVLAQLKGRKPHDKKVS